MAKMYNDQGESKRLSAHLRAAKAQMPETVWCAHEHSRHNRTELSASDAAGCFYCCQTFSAAEVVEWADDEETTALCPRCGIDSVVASSSGFSITKQFLKEMHQHWFEKSVSIQDLKD